MNRLKALQSFILIGVMVLLVVASSSLSSGAKWTSVASIVNLTFDDATNYTTLGDNTGTRTYVPDYIFTNGVGGINGALVTHNLTMSARHWQAANTTVGGISFWWKPNYNSSIDSATGLIANDGSGNNIGDFTVGYRGFNGVGNATAGKIFYYFNTGTSTGGIHSETNNFIAGNWYHIFLKVNSSQIGIYVNGVKENSTTLVGTTQLFGSPANVTLFSKTNATFDEFKIFGSEISDSQITEIYNTEYPTMNFNTKLFMPLNNTYTTNTTNLFIWELNPIGTTIINTSLLIWNASGYLNSYLATTPSRFSISPLSNYTFDITTNYTTLGDNTGVLMPHLNLTNGVSYTNYGIDGAALINNNQYGVINYTNVTNNAGVFFWWKPTINTSLDNVGCIFIQDGSGSVTGHWTLGFQGCNGYGSGGAITFSLDRGVFGGYWTVKTVTNNFIADRWYSIYAKSNTTDISIYVNGVKENITYANVYGGSETALFGNASLYAFSTPAATLNATFDEVKFFNQELNDSQIVELNNSRRYASYLLNLNEGAYQWNSQTYFTDGNNISSSNYTLTIDNSAPVLNITSPRGIQITTDETNYTFSLNITAYDLSPMSTCWYNTSDNSTRTYLTGCNNGTIIFYSQGLKYIYLYGNDTLNNIGTYTQEFTISKVIYSNLTYETQSNNFTLNIAPTSDIPASAKLSYNNVNYSASITNNGSGIYIINAVIDTPLVNLLSNLSFNWIINYYSGSVYYSQSFNQTVAPITLTQCNATYPTQFINFTAYKESDLSRIKPFNFEGVFNYWLGSGTTFKNYSLSGLVNETNICASPADKTYNINSFILYGDNNLSYVSRDYYLNNYEIDNSSENINLYLLENSDATTFIQKVLNSNQQPYPEVYIHVLRYYPSTDSYQTVQVAKTDSNGKSIGFYKTETVFYKHVIKDADNNILLETDRQKIFGESVPYTLTFIIGSNNALPWGEFSETIDGLNYNMSYNKNLKIVTLSYADTSGDFSYINFSVSKINLDTYDTVICSYINLSATNILSCNLSTYTEGEFIAQAIKTNSTDSKLIKLMTITISSAKDTFGTTGVIIAWFILLVMGMAFLYNAKLAAWGEVIAIIFIKLVGLMTIPATYLFGAIALALIITIVVKEERGVY